jgi:hypothetical protein
MVLLFKNKKKKQKVSLALAVLRLDSMGHENKEMESDCSHYSW